MIQSDPQQTLLQAQECLTRGDIKRASRLTDNVLKAHPTYASALAMKAQVLLAVQQPGAAISPIEKALADNPDNASWQVLAARAYAGVIRIDEAFAALDKSQSLPDGLDAGLLCDVGFVYTTLQDHEKAHTAFMQAVELQSDLATAHFNLGMSERFLGNLEVAETCLNESIRLDPNQFEAILTRSDLRRMTENDNYIDDLYTCLDRNLPPLGEIQVCYALAKELEDLGRYSESFDIRKRGADLKHQTTQYDVQGDVQTIGQIINLHNKDNLAALGRGCEDSSPIFILGLPRTGTTLTERIVGSHSKVESVEELRAFAVELVRLCQGQKAKMDMVGSSLQIDMQALGDAYVNAARQLAKNGSLFIDKLPMNFLYCGLISRALPNARIIHLKRNPMDACYAMYKALFKQAYPFSYDLETLAHYYIAYRKLIAHWENTLGERICHVHYEDIVADTEGEARRIIEYCGLEWEDDILDFHKRKRASTTASATQVRQKVYTSSLGKWANYAKELQPLYSRLSEADVLAWPDKTAP